VHQKKKLQMETIALRDAYWKVAMQKTSAHMVEESMDWFALQARA
jgi:hypothetical protein